MSELKAYTYDDMLDGVADVDVEYHPKSEVDATIDELKDEVYNQKWRGDEWARNANDKDKQIAELEAENVKLKRALWMARKAHAVAMFSYWDSHYRDNPNAVYRNRTVDWLRNRWLLILDAIIKKEKEYK